MESNRLFDLEWEGANPTAADQTRIAVHAFAAGDPTLTAAAERVLRALRFDQTAIDRMKRDAG